jgi:CRP-like cAMP-binding protein
MEPANRAIVAPPEQEGGDVTRYPVTPGSVSPAERRRGARIWTDALQELPLFRSLSRRHVAKIAALAREARFHPGTAVVRAGEPGDDFFVILEGTASVLRPGSLPPILLGPGDYCGEMSLLDGGERSATVLAGPDLLCLRLSRGPFTKVIRAEPAIALALLRELAGRVRQLQRV